VRFPRISRDGWRCLELDRANPCPRHEVASPFRFPQIVRERRLQERSFAMIIEPRLPAVHNQQRLPFYGASMRQRNNFPTPDAALRRGD
jgi:hypothetical protein